MFQDCRKGKGLLVSIKKQIKKKQSEFQSLSHQHADVTFMFQAQKNFLNLHRKNSVAFSQRTEETGTCFK